MFEREIGQYEQLRKQYDALVASRMSRQSLMEYNEILLSAHSCAIEGNSFTVDDTRIPYSSSLSPTAADTSMRCGRYVPREPTSISQPSASVSQ